MKSKKYDICITYIEKYWDRITFSIKKDNGIQIRLPYPFVSPNEYIFNKDQFYWDSYFIILGLLSSGKTKLAKGMINNFVCSFNRFGIIPMRNRFCNTGISQPPFFTSMIRKVYEKDKDKRWLRKTVSIAEDELNNYWMDNRKNIMAGKHLIYKGLSRYVDVYLTHHTAENESGWDMTSRFNDRCLNYLPVDLNALLYKYETDLAYFYCILKNKIKERKYLQKAKKRKKIMNALMWDDKKGFFFDYIYTEKKQSNFYSLAGFFPLWANMVSKSQAMKIRDNLNKFEYKHGLASTQRNNLSEEFRQWDYPNGWAPLQWIVIKGLYKYGFHDDAKRLAIKWLEMNKRIFEKTGKFHEKYNVVTGNIGKEGRYPNQVGFGWTNAVFLRLVEEII